MLILNGGGVVRWWEMGWWWGVVSGDKLTNVVLHDRLEPYNKVQVQHTSLLSSWINIYYIQTDFISS